MLKDILRELGFELISEELRPEFFGSCTAFYSKADCSIRLVWDGKEGCGFVQQHCNGRWLNVSDYLMAGDFAVAAQKQAKISQLRQDVAALLR